jgi:subtilisin family serine protease
MFKVIAPVALLIFTAGSANAQTKNIGELNQKYLNWYNLDSEGDRILGASVEKAYQDLLKDKQPKKTIIVAVIDGGVDIFHDDLKDNIWINEDEIANNGIDDDHNGYIDDIHGWNFIGNSNGKNIHHENLEYTRIVKSAPQDPDFQKAKQYYEKELAERMKEKENISNFETAYINAKSIIKEYTGVSVTSAADLQGISSTNPQVAKAREFLESRYKQGFSEKGLADYKRHNADYIEYYLNTEFNPREIVGDDPHSIDNKPYGNPDVKGPRAEHGTSVAGIIAAVRNNNIGTNGIAASVKIMCLRSTPSGDERDKDVALAIRYAADNGAHIINMSFGKDFSPQKKLVDDAVRIAEQKNVLMVHGSGNDGQDLGIYPSYPSSRYLDGSEATNWITVGASSMIKGEETAAIFSNYNSKYVDIFAPGVDVISLDTTNSYSMNDGTSLAAPVVSGVAALVLSYYPDLTPAQLIKILHASSLRLGKLKVLIPDLENPKRKKIKFSALSESGGIVNAFEALKVAEKAVE